MYHANIYKPRCSPREHQMRRGYVGKYISHYSRFGYRKERTPAAVAAAVCVAAGKTRRRTLAQFSPGSRRVLSFNLWSKVLNNRNTPSVTIHKGCKKKIDKQILPLRCSLRGQCWCELRCCCCWCCCFCVVVRREIEVFGIEVEKSVWYSWPNNVE